jgi:uncharacterized membrane protein (UPF0127 family)
MRFSVHIAFVVTVLAGLTLARADNNMPVCEVVLIDQYKAETVLKVEIAKTPKDLTYGLMFRKSLGENAGMLFVFQTDQYLNFWMKNTYLPLSIAYIDKNGTIQSIQDMAPLDESQIYPSPVPVRYALEVNQGFFKKHSIKAGNHVIFNGCFSKQDSIPKR